ncbi:hypothetical protein BST36_25875 [Mycolicibacterium moriokaense]|uniref:Uncharacterized protein n=1 Tax=Mycolicibacterium moriokaense TaxID=39691 RepID=A0AAD1HE32_9MYCO|nr:hypothetical protein [Mycolicibacterium moriokaense]MCV7041589.1 hypothetical protein [Mycolicibacterium moriokaense]ORB16460.1 hypothetical protein BST36_25875 [Mycolicibacterium moriokaense]BBX03702.1 hypothetical protein MMOR_46380 [Mycolicibacterium moriokaense]
MGLIIRLLELLIVIVPVAVGAVAAIRAFSSAKNRGAQQDEIDGHTNPDPGPAPSARGNPAALWRTITRALEEHSRTESRWLSYELDPAKLLDYPLMTDLRAPLTERFHKAKIRADLLRPVRAEDLLEDRESAATYLAAVEEFVAAFNAAESEAIRRRRDDFPEPDKQRLDRAQRLLRVASNEAATPSERERAYDRARQELEGLIVLPPSIRAAIERGIAGELDP